MEKLCTVFHKYVLFKQNIILPNMLTQISRMKKKWFISKLLLKNYQQIVLAKWKKPNCSIRRLSGLLMRCFVNKDYSTAVKLRRQRSLIKSTSCQGLHFKSKPSPVTNLSVSHTENQRKWIIVPGRGNLHWWHQNRIPGTKTQSFVSGCHQQCVSMLALLPHSWASHGVWGWADKIAALKFLWIVFSEYQKC